MRLSLADLVANILQHRAQVGRDTVVWLAGDGASDMLRDSGCHASAALQEQKPQKPKRQARRRHVL